jgi:hypothetical protein
VKDRGVPHEKVFFHKSLLQKYGVNDEQESVFGLECEKRIKSPQQIFKEPPTRGKSMIGESLPDSRITALFFSLRFFLNLDKGLPFFRIQSAESL